jgi:hypothetical protein
MSTIKISDLATSAISLTDFIVKAGATGVATKNTVQGISDVINANNTLFKETIAIADIPSENGWYFASESGTYTNCGGLVIDNSDNIAIIVVSGTFDVFNKIDIPLNITIDATPTTGSTNALASGGSLLNKSGKTPFLYNASKYSNFNTVTQNLELAGATRIFIGNKFYYVRGDDNGFATQRNIDLSSLADGIILINIDESLGTSALSYRVVSHNATDIGDNEVIIGYYGNYGEYGYINGKFKINGFLQEKSGNSYNFYNATKNPNFNTVTKNFTIYANSKLYTGKSNYSLGASDIVLDLTSTQNGVIYYNLLTNVFAVKNASFTTDLEDNEIVIATYDNWGATLISMNGNYTVNSFEDIQAGNTPYIYNATAYPNFDTTEGTENFTVPNSSRLMSGVFSTIITGNTPSGNTDFVLDISANPTGVIYFDLLTNLFVNRSHTVTTKLENHQLFICTYAGYGLQVSMTGNYTVNDKQPKIGRKINKILSPNYKLTEITSQSTDLWSDFIVINDELWVFVASTDEEHTLSNGKINIFDLATYTLQKTITHNFGHCNTVSYDVDSDVLMIGNLPGNVAYPAALYLIYDWATFRSSSDIDFTTDVTKDFIDITSITVGQSAVGVFGETNIGVRNIAYISNSFNRNWSKLLLGMGTNNLGSGTFTTRSADRYNGSFKVLESCAYINEFNDLKEVTQGVAYHKGSVLTSNGHNGLFGSKWNFDDDGLINRDLIESKIYNESGVEIDYYTEGMTVYNGKILHGLIYFASASADRKYYISEYEL